VTLLHVLGEEVSALAELRHAWDRLQLLQKVTGELTAAASAEDISATVIDNAREFLGALAGRVFLLGDDRLLRSVASRGGSEDLATRFTEIDLEADLPGAEVMRTGQAIVLGNMAEIAHRYPALSGLSDGDRCLHIAPLTVDGHRLGVLSLTFPCGGRIEEDRQSAFIRALADALAQALERALTVSRLAAANERLAFLADASIALSGSSDYAATVEAVGRLMVPRLADWCVVHVLDGGRLRTAGLHHADPAKLAWAQTLRDRWPTHIDAATGAPNVVRTGVSEIYPHIPAELIERMTTDPEHLRAIQQLGMSSGLVVALTGRGPAFGAITLIYAESGRRYQPSDIPFAEDVARRAALALETAAALSESTPPHPPSGTQVGLGRGAAEQSS
jgi:GAF domain-containing protein